MIYILFEVECPLSLSVRIFIGNICMVSGGRGNYQCLRSLKTDKVAELINRLLRSAYLSRETLISGISVRPQRDGRQSNSGFCNYMFTCGQSGGVEVQMHGDFFLILHMRR